MKENCLSKNPLLRDGTSRPGRILRTLLPSYVSVDERNMKDLIQFTQQFSSEINFFNEQNTVAGDWQAFFQLTQQDWDSFSLDDHLKQLRQWQETHPHWALFFAFLYLFRIAQDDLNTITKRHLDFYYRDVLQLEEQPPVADQVSLVFQLAKHVSQHLIKKGTLLKAGKDANGEDLLYQVEKDVVLNKARVTDIRAVFANIHNVLPTDSGSVVWDHHLFASPVANSGDGIGGDFTNEQADWRTFGRPETSDSAADRPLGDIGFAIASPQLFLAEGIRTVTLTFSGSGTNLLSSLPDGSFRVFFSGEKDWIEGVNPVAVTDGLQVTLQAEQEAVVAYNAASLLDPFETAYPVMKVLLNPDQYAYETIKGIRPDSVKIELEVSDVRQLILQNDQAPLDPGKPFQPFTNRPLPGSNFYIGSWEVFQKELSKLELQIKWSDLPGDFKTHYALYTDSVRNNSAFKFKASSLENKTWVDLASPNLVDLFDDPLPGVGIYALPIDLNQPDAIGRKPGLQPFSRYDVTSIDGFMRLQLDTVDFGHKAYPNLYAQQAIALAKYTGDGPPDDPPIPQLPNAPYTPLIESLALSYGSDLDINLAAADGVDQYFHITPFGVKESYTSQIVPVYEAEGHLYLGFEQLAPPQTLSIHFQVAEGSANPDRTKQTLEWHYLSNNEWIALDSKRILSDATDGLLNSGIIQLDIPKDSTNQNTLLPKELHWLRVSVTEFSDAVCRLIDVKAQAVQARFSDNGNDPLHLEESLPAGTISKLYRSDSAVDKINQPYNSLGGKLQESSTAFYTRVSERLRHKRRAITMWDYERLVLQQFPEVYKVKAVNHTRFSGTLTNYSEIKPGHVTLIVISNVQNKNAVDPLRPKTSLSLLSAIDSYLAGIRPPCIHLHVKNPLYESIRVAFEVKFKAGVDSGFFEQKLNEEIRFFLSPWASECPKDIAFGGKVHKSMIINFVEERSYVDYVSCFKMYHIVPTDPNNKPHKDIEEAQATTTVSILGSADEHEISVIPIDQEACVCDDNEIKSTPQYLFTGDNSC